MRIVLFCAAGVVPDSTRGDLLEEVANLVGSEASEMTLKQ